MSDTTTATDDERAAAKARIQAHVWDELQRVVTAIRIDNALGVAPALVIRLDRFGGGPALRIEDDHLDGLPLAKLQELAGQDIEVAFVAGRIELSSPSWAPDRIPF